MSNFVNLSLRIHPGRVR